MKITLLMSLVIVLGFIVFGYMHEQVHVEIFQSYGVESHVEYLSHFPDFVTIADSSTENCDSNCVLAHNINEAISYPLMAFYILIGFGLLCIIWAIEEL